MIAASGLNPTGGVNPYSTPISHYSGSTSASANHAPSPPPFSHLGESQESSPKLFSRDGAAYGRSSGGHRYNSFQHHHPTGPTYPPPPVPTSAPPSSTSRFSHFQSLGPSLIQAEAALWGDQRRNGGIDPADKNKSRGEDQKKSFHRCFVSMRHLAYYFLFFLFFFFAKSKPLVFLVFFFLVDVGLHGVFVSLQIYSKCAKSTGLFFRRGVCVAKRVC